MNALQPAVRPDIEMVSTHDLKDGDELFHYGAHFRLKGRKEHPTNEFSNERDREIEQANGVCITFQTDLLNDGGDIPKSWLQGGWTIQGNRAASWARVVQS